MNLYTMATSRYFETLLVFPIIEERLQKAGTLWIDLFLSEDEKNSINEVFPNRIYK